MGTHPLYVQQQRRGGKARCFRLAIPLAVFAYLSRNIWKKHCHIGDSITVVFTLSLYAKYFHTLPGHLLGRNNKKAHTWRLAQKNKFCRIYVHAMLGWRDTSSSSTTASAGKKPRAKASCGSTQRRFCPSAPQGSPANSETWKK